VFVSPTYVPDLVHACLDLLMDEASGVWHLANTGEVTWAGLARQAAELSGLDVQKVAGRPLESFGLAAARPRYSVLTSERSQLLPALDEALARYLEEDEIKPVQRAAGGGRVAGSEPTGSGEQPLEETDVAASRWMQRQG
jgi:dTDP-4-dehydrorhamnose reductase